ncbi:hypothetical protein F5Y16DRAFT_368567 [Xylariaceae sp. FL0255]|nr:hypothetical protein F5Y16DRAFT_368567 [Xylariaceae sp. FL0255]
MAPLFSRRPKGNVLIKSQNLEDRAHMRKWSSSSTISQSSTSSETSHGNRFNCYDPLALHPPLRLNTSPHITPEYTIPEYDIARYQEDEAREDRFFNQTRHAEDHIQSMAEYSPIKGENCYFEGPRARPYVYDQNAQWPLKDWQAIPPGIAEIDSVYSPRVRPSAPQRRNTDWMEEKDVFVKRGAWKRQGIIFHLDPQDQEFEEQHFELPE